MKLGDLVQIKSNIDFPLDLYGSWGRAREILDDKGEMVQGQVGIVLEIKEINVNAPIGGACLLVNGMIGWTYKEFLEVLPSLQ
jgi:hypothetical protein